jgi:hypothetical protein
MKDSNKYLPKNKHDFESVEVLTHLEETIVLPLLPELFEWLQDMNWPIAFEIVNLLRKYPNETVQHVKMIFSQRDTGWIYNILTYVISDWETELVSRLSSGLGELAQKIDNYDDTDLLAIRILWKHGLIEAEEATVIFKRKLTCIEDELHQFTTEQKAVFSVLEEERQHILSSDVSRIVKYIQQHSEILNQKHQYENSLRRVEEIEEAARDISGIRRDL